MRFHRPLVSAFALLAPLAVTAAAHADPPPPPPSAPATPSVHIELASLNLLLQKGIISQAEYDSAVRDLTDSAGMQAGDASTVAVGKWATTIYGFVEADNIYDSTQSFNETAGNGAVAHPYGFPGLPPATWSTQSSLYAASHPRLQMSVRNSRFGFRLKAPEYNGIRTSALMEFDLLGNEGSPGYLGSSSGTVNQYQNSEAAFYTNPAARVRHAALRVETPVVDLLMGQYWALMGWQNVYHPNTVEIQGVPGELYSRTPQIRVSKTLHAGDMTLEAAGALMRPPIRDSAIPEVQWGVRAAYDKWRGVTTGGATGTSIQPLSIALTGDWKHLVVPEYDLHPAQVDHRQTTAVAIDAFIPVLPGTKDKKDNSLSLNGEFVTGYGINDQYTGLTGGMTLPNIPNTSGMNPAPVYPQDFDNGLLMFDRNGTPHAIQWTTYLVGMQYYLPGLGGREWISANYSHTQSANAKNFANYGTTPPVIDIAYPNARNVRESEDWFDVNLFADVTKAVRMGLEYANFNDRYADGIHAINHRVQLSGFFIF
jgi:hypothetical protein